MVLRFWDSVGDLRDNATTITRLQKFLREKRGFSVERCESTGANNCLFDALSKSMNGVSVIDSMAKTRTSTPLPNEQHLRQASVDFVEEIMETGLSHTSGLYEAMQVQLIFEVGNGEETNLAVPVQQRRHLKYSVLYIDVPIFFKNDLKALTFVHRAALDICHVATLSACKPHTCMLGIHTLLNMQ